MKIGEFAKHAGLSAHTLRYYERIGLLPPANRDSSGQRDYDGAILTWIEFLNRLNLTGMPVRERLRYAALRNLGPQSEGERSALLQRHRERVRASLIEIQASLVILDAKISAYAQSKKGNQPDDADPTPRRKPVRARQARTR